mgnify:CR=1 FL=1
MDTWNLRKDADFKTKIAYDLCWIPADSLSCYNTKNSNCKEGPHNLYELLFLFQSKDLEEFYDDRILKLDKKLLLTWEFFDTPERVVKSYKRGHCAVFSLWLNYYLTKMYDKCGYIEIIRNKNKSWHVINYVYINGLYYIIDPSIYIKKYSEIIPVEDGMFKTYAKSKLITGGILQTSDLNNFVLYYQKYISLANSSYLFLELSSYKLPPFAIEGIDNEYTIYYPQGADIKIIGDYNKDMYKIIKTEVNV